MPWTSSSSKKLYKTRRMTSKTLKTLHEFKLPQLRQRRDRRRFHHAASDSRVEPRAAASREAIPAAKSCRPRPVSLGCRARSDERRVGTGCVRKCRSRWSPSHKKKKKKK